MKFQTKIFLSTLIILISTLILNSVLSISSFENIYVKSLISTFETGGKNLKRKIEQSLKFGKPLDKYQGMDQLLQDFMINNNHIEFTSIVNQNKEILHHTDISRIGSLLEFDIPQFTKERVLTKNLNNFYVTFLPLYSSSKKLSGHIVLGFPKESIKNRIHSMAFSNFKTLSVLILITGIALILFLSLIIVKPLKSDIKKISDQILSIESNTKPIHEKDNQFKSDLEIDETASILDKSYLYFDISKIKNEILLLNYYLNIFLNSYSNGLAKIENLNNEIIKFKLRIKKESNDIEKFLKNYMEENNEDYLIKELYKNFLRENIHVKELISLTFFFITFDKQDETNNDLGT